MASDVFKVVFVGDCGVGKCAPEPPSSAESRKKKLLISEIMHATRVQINLCWTLTGKSALLRRFTENAFRQEGQEEPDREAEEGIKPPTLQRSLDVDGKQVNLVLSDTKGQECFGHVTCSLYQGMNGACSTSLSHLSQSFLSITIISLPFSLLIWLKVSVLFFVVTLCFGTTQILTFLSQKGIIVVYDVANRDSFKNMNDWIVEVERYKRDNASVFIVGNIEPHTLHTKKRRGKGAEREEQRDEKVSIKERRKEEEEVIVCWHAIVHFGFGLDDSEKKKPIRLTWPVRGLIPMKKAQTWASDIRFPITKRQPKRVPHCSSVHHHHLLLLLLLLLLLFLLCS